MSTGYQQQQNGSFEGSRDKRRNFLKQARQELITSQDELQQKRLILHTSFDIKSNKHGDSSVEAENLFTRLKPPKTPFQGSSSDKIAYKLREINSNGTKSPYIENYNDVSMRLMNENERINYDNLGNPLIPMNLENTLELSRIGEVMAFGGTSKATSQNITPQKRVSRKEPLESVVEEKNGTISQKEHKKILDKELVSLETRMIQFFKQEKKNILKENMNQMIKIENKMKEKYNSVVKDFLENKSREEDQSDILENSQQQHRSPLSNTPQKEVSFPSINDQIITPKKKRQNEDGLDKNNDKMAVKYPEDFAEIMKEVKLNLSQDPEDDEYYQIQENTGLVLQENVNNGKNKTPVNQGKDYVINEMSEKIKSLELENETLRKRVSLMEWLLKSESEKASGKDNFEKPDYNKFISPKIKDYMSRMSSPTKPLEQETPVKLIDTKESPVSPDVVVNIMPQISNDKDNYISELQEQIRRLTLKVEVLRQENEDLLSEVQNNKDKNRINEGEQEESEEKLTKDLNQAVEFWKTKCEQLTNKYFDVVKKLRIDNENLREGLTLKYKDFKRVTLKDLQQIQQAYQEKVYKLAAQMKKLEAQGKDSHGRHNRATSTKVKAF